MKKILKTTLSSGNKPLIVFFGSGPVAAQCLHLLQKHCEIEIVITKASTEYEMKAAAPSVPLYLANSKVELDDLFSQTQFTSQLAVLIDFGIIVSKKVIDSFELGIINSHFSLLPQWRGADPITFSILSGQAKTGVSLMLINEGMDTGKILVQKSLPVPLDATTPTLTQALIKLSDELLKNTLHRYQSGVIKPRQQPHPDRATYSRKLTKKDGILDFSKPAEVLEREIRAFIEWPKSRTTLAGIDVIIQKAHVQEHTKGSIGEVYVTEDKKIGIHTKKSALIIEELKPAGKNSMPAQAFLAGYSKNI